MSALERLKAEFGGHKKAIKGIKEVLDRQFYRNRDIENRINRLENPPIKPSWWKRLFKRNSIPTDYRDVLSKIKKKGA